MGMVRRERAEGSLTPPYICSLVSAPDGDWVRVGAVAILEYVGGSWVRYREE